MGLETSRQTLAALAFVGYRFFIRTSCQFTCPLEQGHFLLADSTSPVYEKDKWMTYIACYQDFLDGSFESFHLLGSPVGFMPILNYE
eukprot:scaffold1093_cov61-Cylindrotheca_fusiformis.AAC.2